MWRLRELALADFKSFEGCHMFGPLDGFQFSCVVGSNGSGKSNIVDALAFVLGSSSRSLRSSRFAELCHKDRILGIPSGRRAKVKVVFVEDGGESELTFERVVTSDSSTSFHVNGRTVDRRAYNKALMDIGAYGKGCIVAQGFIESISLSSALEKGQLIDSLSGSAAHKEDYDRQSKRIQEMMAELKVLGARKENVEHSVRNMKKQYAELKRYTDIKQRLRKAHSMLTKVSKLHVNWQENELRQQMEALQTQINEYEAGIVNQRQAAQNNISIQRRNMELVRQLRKDLEVIVQNIQARESTKIDTERKKNELSIKIRLAEERLAQAAADRQKTKADYKESMRKLDSCIKDIEAQRKKAQSTLNSNRYHNMPEVDKERAKQQVVVSSSEMRLRELDQNIKDSSLQVKKLNERASILGNRQSDYTEKLKMTEAKIASLQSSIRDLECRKNELVTASKEEREMNLEITRLENQIRGLRDLLYCQNDWAEKDSHVCTYLSQYRKVFGRLGDLITVTNPLHITAIGAALGKQRESIVVETYEDAVECIKLLKQKQWGVIEFIPLQGVRQEKNILPANLRHHPELFRPAVDCVTVEKAEIKVALNAVLGDTVIVEGDIDRARHLAYREWNSALRIVTTDGQRIAKNGNITLGSRGQGNANASRAGNENKLAQLEKELNDLKTRQKQEFRKSVDLHAELGVIEEQLRSNNSTLVMLRAQIDELRRLLDQIAADLQSHTSSIAVLQEKCDQLSAERKVLVSAIETSCGEDTELLKSYQEAVEAEQRLVQLREEQMKEIKNRVLKYTSFLNNCGFTSIDISNGDWESLLVESSKILEAWFKAKPLIKEAEAAIGAYRRELKEIERLWEDSEMNDGEVHQQEEITGRIKEIENTLHAISQQNNQMSEQLRQLMNKKSKCEREKYEVQVKLEDLHKGIVACPDENNDEEVVIEEELQSERDFMRMIERLSRQTGECEAELQVMVVNHEAESMLEQLKQRLQEISDEFDQKRSEKHLIDLDLVELRELRKGLFMKCFNSINKSLDDIYVQLTGASSFGTAQIELEDEVSAEPFNKGVIFHVIPPGKRYTDIENLSGGEKAMAALSLLFACQKFKRSPFIVLDEVDAPLDLENLTCLRDYLRTCSFQVFMITLKEE